MGSNFSKIAISICAHPDDCEFRCAGTLELLRKRGWQVHIATLTSGQCGSADKSPEEISSIRKNEAFEAAGLLGGNYYCLECEDAFVMYDKESVTKVVGLIREVRPTVVFAPSPVDYHIDHENTSRIVRSACFLAGVPNIKTDYPPFEPVPYLYYMDPNDGKGIYGEKISPGFVVDISNVINEKAQMLACHQSQREWLKIHHGNDEFLDSMRSFSANRGMLVGCEYGEGFRQHLGHCFPQINIIENELSDMFFASETNEVLEID